MRKFKLFTSIGVITILFGIVACSPKISPTHKAFFYDETGMNLILSTTFAEGNNPTYPEEPTKESDETFTYSFDKWVTEVGGNTEVNFKDAKSDTNAFASFSKEYIDYIITFKLENGENDVVRTLHYGDTIVAPTDFTKTGYTFTGWDKPVSQTVTQNETYTAQWEINKYTVTFKNFDDNVLQTDDNVLYGSHPSYDGSTPVRDNDQYGSYTFTGWSLTKDGSILDLNKQTITSNSTYFAVYSLTYFDYKITFKLENGDNDVVRTLHYGDTIVAPTDFTKTGYTFTGWDKPVSQTVTQNETYTAQWEINKYTVTFKNFDDNVLQTDDNVLYGSHPSYDGDAPTRSSDSTYTYSFKGWSLSKGGEVVKLDEEIIMANTTYFAAYDSTYIDYTVVFMNGENVISSNKYHYGETITVPTTIPTKAETDSVIYKFAGWDKEITTCDGNKTYNATFDEYNYLNGFVYDNNKYRAEAATYGTVSCTKFVGLGDINIKGAFLDTDDILENYSFVSFDICFPTTSTENLIYGQWFRADGYANTLDSDSIRFYGNSGFTQTLVPNVWYTASIKIDAKRPLSQLSLSFYSETSSEKTIYLTNVRFGNDFEYTQFKADSLGFIAGSGLTKETRKTVGGDDIVFMHGNGTVYFKDVQDASGNVGRYFYSDYNYVVFDVYCTYHDAPHAYVPYEDCWMHPDADWSWSTQARDPELVTSYQNGELVNKFNVNTWYTMCFKVAHDPNAYGAGNPSVYLELGATAVYLTNLRFTKEVDMGTSKTADDMPTYDSLGFYSNSNNATLTRTTFGGFDVVELTTTGQAAIYIPDLGVHTSMTDGSTKGVGGICSSGYSFVSFDVYVESGNNYYLTSPWQAIWHNAQGYRDANDSFIFYDIYGNVSSGGIASYGNWYTIKCQLNNAQGNDWCFNWGVNDESGSHLYLKNIVFYA